MLARTQGDSLTWMYGVPIGELLREYGAVKGTVLETWALLRGDKTIEGALFGIWMCLHPPNYPFRYPKYHPIETLRPLIEVHWGL